MISLLQTVAKPVVATIVKQAVATEKPVNDALEILSKVNEFYSSAWDKLILFGTVSFAIVGIFVPLIIQWYQKRVLIINEKEFESRVNKKIDQIKNEITDELSKKIDEKFKLFDKELEVAKQLSVAQSYHIQGNLYAQKDEFYEALKDFISASKHYSYCQDAFNLKRSLENIGFMLDRLKKTDTDNLKNVDLVDLVKILDKIDKEQKTNVLLDFTNEIRAKLHNMK